jgi:hypothetical protein
MPFGALEILVSHFGRATSLTYLKFLMLSFSPSRNIRENIKLRNDFIFNFLKLIIHKSSYC